MAIIRDVPLSLDMEQVLRYQGIGKRDNPESQVMVLLPELLRAINHEHLLEPATLDQ